MQSEPLLRANHDADATAETFAPRAVFGCYIGPFLKETAGIEQVQDTVIDYRKASSGAILI
jgi:hypothetical protein